MHEFRGALIEWLIADSVLVTRTEHTSDDARIVVSDPRYDNETPLLSVVSSSSTRFIQEVDEFYSTLAVLNVQTSPSDDEDGSAADLVLQRVVEMAKNSATGDASFSNANVSFNNIFVEDPPLGSDYESDVDKWITQMTLRISWRRVSA